MVAHLAHYQKTTFESFARNHIAGSSKGRTLDSLPSNLGSIPRRATKREEQIAINKRLALSFNESLLDGRGVPWKPLPIFLQNNAI